MDKNSYQIIKNLLQKAYIAFFVEHAPEGSHPLTSSSRYANLIAQQHSTNCGQCYYSSVCNTPTIQPLIKHKYVYSYQYCSNSVLVWPYI